MDNLIYVEGFSEENLVKKLFHATGRDFSEDAAIIPINNSVDYLRNCEGDSSILPAIVDDAYLLRSVTGKKLIIIQDIPTTTCYSIFKASIQTLLTQEGITLPLEVINSRPVIEKHYFESIETLKKTIKAYYNQRKSATLTNYNILDPQNILDPTDHHTLQLVLRKANIGFSKKDFSERFFATLFQSNLHITITKRFFDKLET